MWPHTRDRVLVDSQELSARRYVPTPRLSTHIRISERVESAAVEPPNASSFRSRPPSTRARAIQRSNKCPARLSSREHHWLAIVTSCHNTVFAGPRECDTRQSTDPDVLDHGAPGIDNADRAVMACRCRSNKLQYQGGDNAYSQRLEPLPRAKS